GGDEAHGERDDTDDQQGAEQRRQHEPRTGHGRTSTPGLLGSGTRSGRARPEAAVSRSSTAQTPCRLSESAPTAGRACNPSASTYPVTSRRSTPSTRG